MNDITGDKTLKSSGCAEACLAMTLNSHEAKIDGNLVNPKNYNEYLEKNGEYSGNLIKWGKETNGFDVEYVDKVECKEINAHVDKDHDVYLRTKKGHYVLATGHTSTHYEVNNPGSGKANTASKNDVVHAQVYRKSSPPKSKRHKKYFYLGLDEQRKISNTFTIQLK